MIDFLFFAAISAVGIVLVLLAYFLRLQARYPEPAHAHEVHRVIASDGWQLRLHRRKPTGGAGEPVFFMHSLLSNHLNFEVPYGYSLVDYLAKAGYDCWTFDSRACRDAVAPRRDMRYSSTVEDILLKDIPAALQHIRDETGYSRVHWVGHSMGGMLLYAYDLAFNGDGLASGTTLGAPPGFKGYRHVSHDALIWLNRRAHTVLSDAFRGMAPYFDFWRPVSRYLPINWDNVHSRLRAPDLFHAAELPAPGIGEQMDGWASGKPWVMCDGALDVGANLHRIRTPLLAIFGGIDPFVSKARAREFVDAIENDDRQMIFLSRANGDSANYNHIDLAFAREGEREVFEPILHWLRAHPAGGAKPRTKARAGLRRRKASKSRTGGASLDAVPPTNVRLSTSASVPAQRKPARRKPSTKKK